MQRRSPSYSRSAIVAERLKISKCLQCSDYRWRRSLSPAIADVSVSNDSGRKTVVVAGAGDQNQKMSPMKRSSLSYSRQRLKTPSWNPRRSQRLKPATIGDTLCSRRRQRLILLPSLHWRQNSRSIGDTIFLFLGRHRQRRLLVAGDCCIGDTFLDRHRRRRRFFSNQSLHWRH